MLDALSSIRRGASAWLAKTRLPKPGGGREPARDLGSSRTALVFPMLPLLGMPWHLAWQRPLCEDLQDRGPHAADAQHGRLDRHQPWREACYCLPRAAPVRRGRCLGRIWAQKGSNPLAGGLNVPQLRRHLDGGVAASRGIRGSSRAPLLMGDGPSPHIRRPRPPPILTLACSGFPSLFSASLSNQQRGLGQGFHHFVCIAAPPAGGDAVVHTATIVLSRCLAVSLSRAPETRRPRSAPAPRTRQRSTAHRIVSRGFPAWR